MGKHRRRWDWSTRRWRRTFGAESVVDISWTIRPTRPPAFRIVHDGNAKSLWGTFRRSGHHPSVHRGALTRVGGRARPGSQLRFSTSPSRRATPSFTICSAATWAIASGVHRMFAYHNQCMAAALRSRAATSAHRHLACCQQRTPARLDGVVGVAAGAVGQPANA